MTELTAQFFTKHSDEVNANNFKFLYDEAKHSNPPILIADMTKSLLDADINPLNFMDEIPVHFLAYDYEVTSMPRIPGRIKTICMQAFCHSAIAGEVIVPGSVKKIEARAFSECMDLEEIHIEEGLEILEMGVFASCSNLQFLSLPSTLQSIGSYLFIKSLSLKELTYRGTIDEWHAIEKNDKWNHNSAISKIQCRDGVIDL